MALGDGEGRPAALLVDADNVTSHCVEFALAQLAGQGCRVTIRRAYGGHQKLADMKDCLLRHAVRPFVNQGKSTTDALLVVDTMDLLYADRLPAVVAIASSDADFAPLAVRLREAGMQVICFAHEGKSADVDLSRCYDQLVYVDERAAAKPVAVAKGAPAAAKRPGRTAASRKAAPAPEPVAAPADPVRQQLEAIDGFRDGRALELNEVVKKLRDGKFLGKSASGIVFLRKNAPYLELSPPDKPTKVRLRAGAA